MGKDKKQQDSAEDLTKGQTLAELDKEMRETKKADSDKVVFDNEDGDLEHEVIHSDELTADVDVKKVTGSQRRLWLLVLIAVGFLGGGGFFFYTQIEDGQGISLGGGGSGQIQQNITNEEIVPTSNFAYAISTGSNTAENIKLSDSSKSTIDTGAKMILDSSSDSFQVSSNGSVRATRSGNGIYVINGKAENSILSDKVNDIKGWVLSPDGTSLYALVNSDLYKFDTVSAEGGIVSENFTPVGEQTSRLYFARDGSLKQFAKSGKLLYWKVFKTSSAKTEELEHEVIRFERINDFNFNSLSPDGLSLVFRAVINEKETLQLLSLNSFVLRTIFVADEPGSFASSFAWSQDSNNLIVNIGGSAPKLAELKVGTLQKEIIAEASSEFVNLQWSPDKKFVSFVQNNKLKMIELDTYKVTDLLNSVNVEDVTGWYQN